MSALESEPLELDRPKFKTLDPTLSNFLSGVSTNTAHYSEVGLLNVDVQDSNYGDDNSVISATAIDIGRFTPDHFTQKVVDSGSFKATSGASFAYSGEMDGATKGAISYSLLKPILEITARNAQGNITRNYYEDSQGSANDYMKLSASDIKINPTSSLVLTKKR